MILPVCSRTLSASASSARNFTSCPWRKWTCPLRDGTGGWPDSRVGVVSAFVVQSVVIISLACWIKQGSQRSADPRKSAVCMCIDTYLFYWLAPSYSRKNKLSNKQKKSSKIGQLGQKLWRIEDDNP